MSVSILTSWCQRVRCTFLSDLSSNRSFQLLKFLNKDTRLSAFKQPSWWFIHLNLNMKHALHLYIYSSSIVSLQFIARLFFGCLGFFVLFRVFFWGFFGFCLVFFSWYMCLYTHSLPYHEWVLIFHKQYLNFSKAACCS